jgi:PIN domain nuclease of toxin-antitoxin system
LLLDTNVLLWTLSSAGKISARARRAMSRPATSLNVSVVSVLEIVLKHQSGKLRIRGGLAEAVDDILYHSPWTILPIGPEYLPVLAVLPTFHKDPFDRLLIAQARHLDMAILTPDEEIKKHQVRTIW